MKKIKKYTPCQECGPLPVNHFQKWLTDLLDLLFLSYFSFLTTRILQRLEILVEKILVRLRIISAISNFPRQKISLRTTVFIEEAQKYGMKFLALRSPFGYINHFWMEIPFKKNKGRLFSFEGLPRAEFLNSQISQIIDDKALVKLHLKKAGFPVAEGRAFWWFEKKIACQWAIKHLEFPLVVKPRIGSMSQHVTVNIQDIDSLKLAIDKTVSYCPMFIIEKFVSETNVYRATVIDFDFIACVQRVPAHVIGDGIHTIRELIEIKNTNPARGNPRQKDTTIYKLVIDETTEKLLKKQNYQFADIPPKGKIVYLQEKIILDLGADLFEVTPKVHPDNLQLFRSVAKLFNIRVVGIDFLAQDISLSWQFQPSAILELNSMPYIDMHHFPTTGVPQNVAGALVKMVLKYYLPSKIL